MSVYFADLALAQACLRGEPEALEDLTLVVARALSNLPGTETPAERTVGRVRERLLAGSGGGQPVLARYDGRGTLRAWVQRGLLRAHRRSLHLSQEHKGQEEGREQENRPLEIPAEIAPSTESDPAPAS